MIWVPSGQNRPHIRLFRFGHSRPMTVLVTDAGSSEEALEQYEQRPGEFRRTEIIVSARKGRHDYPVTHELAHLENEFPDVQFIAAMESQIYWQKCAAADAQWKADKEKRRDLIRQLAHDTGKADIDSLPAKIRAHIAIEENGHWFWQEAGKIRLKKYGRASHKGKRWAAHRLVYTLLVGEIPDGIIIRHNCNIPACVNPAHHQLGIEEDNFRDMVNQDRAPWQVKRRRLAERCKAALDAESSSGAILKTLLRFQKYLGDVRAPNSVHHVLFAAMRERCAQLDQRASSKGTIRRKLPPTNRLRRPSDVIRAYVVHEQRLIDARWFGPRAETGIRMRKALLRASRRMLRALWNRQQAK